VLLGVTSSVITALLSVAIKKSLAVVKGSALHLSWYTNLSSSVILIPLMLATGELPEVTKLFQLAVDPPGYRKKWT
jgi:GDP-fucose transporter C1